MIKKILQNDKIFVSFIIAILVNILFLPISSDLCIYITAGKFIAEGKHIYYDFVDIKTPIFYYVYSIIYKIFGSSEMSIRFFDFLYQVLTVFVLFKLTNKIFNNKIIAKLSVFTYTTAYACVSYQYTMHTESFTGLIILFLIFNTIFNLNKYNGLINGIIIGTLIALKYSFVFVFFGIIIYYLIESDFKFGKFFKSLIYIAIGVLFPIIISIFLIKNDLSFSSYILTLKFTKFYVSLNPINMAMIKIIYNNLIILFSDKYSFTFTASLIFAFYYKSKISDDKLDKSFLILTILLFSLFVSFASEFKFVPTHFVRLYVIYSIFTAYGLYNLIVNIEKVEYNKYNRISKIVLIVFLIAGSNIIRFTYQIMPSIYYFTNKAKYNKFYTDEGIGGGRNDYLAIAKYIQNNKIRNYKVYGTAALMINYFDKNDNFSKFPQSIFFLSDLHIKEWENDAMNEMLNSKILFIQTNDNVKGITGYDYSTYDRMNKLPNFQNILNSYFKKDTTINNFAIFSKKQL